MSRPEFTKTQSFNAEPFKDRIHVVFNVNELLELKTHLDQTLSERHGQEGYAKLDDNYGLVTLHSPGMANSHIVYLPIIERIYLGMRWMAMQNVIVRLVTQIALKAVTVAGYKPLTESVMFTHLHSRIMEQVLRVIERKVNGTLSIVPQPAIDLSVGLTPAQWLPIDRLPPCTLADLARTQCMVEDNHKVVIADDHTWFATTYYY